MSKMMRETLTIQRESAIIRAMCKTHKQESTVITVLFIHYFKEGDLCQQKRIIQFPKLVLAK